MNTDEMKKITLSQALRYAAWRGVKTALDSTDIITAAGIGGIVGGLNATFKNKKNSKITLEALAGTVAVAGIYALSGAVYNVATNVLDMKDADELYLRNDGEIVMVTLNVFEED